MAAGTDFDNHRSCHRAQPQREAALLRRSASAKPAPVAEHQHVGPKLVATHRTARQRRQEAALILIHIRLPPFCLSNCPTASLHALQVVDRAVDFANVGRIETRFGELTIDIAGEDEGAMRQARCPAVPSRPAGAR